MTDRNIICYSQNQQKYFPATVLMFRELKGDRGKCLKHNAFLSKHEQTGVANYILIPDQDEEAESSSMYAK